MAAPTMTKTTHALTLLTGVWLLAMTSAAPAVDFQRKILPILSENCFQCHGPDEAQNKAGLRLDSADRAHAAIRNTGRRAVVPGDPVNSELYARISADDVDDRMPPVATGLSLTEAEKQLIYEWIESGAEYQKHWSFERVPDRVALPEVGDGEWPRNAIDRFILARLEKEDVKPAAELERRKLIRRVTLDLTGLPPRREHVRAFLEDTRPGAYERVVDRLLASPEFGEHVAFRWLQYSRYADTSGFQHDFRRDSYPWRTWVIRAFNDGLPFDDFVTSQLAGDLLPEATADQKLATAFVRNHRVNCEFGSLEEEYLVENTVDRVDTFATVFLGLTMSCARCHDHKFDPLSMRDFYALFAFFNNSADKAIDPGGLHAHPYTPPYLVYPDVDQSPKLAALEAELALLRERVAQPGGDGSGLPGDVARIKEIEEAIKKLHDAAPHVMVMEERDKRRPTYLLERGSYEHPRVDDGVISPNTPGTLPAFSSSYSRDRLGLARWLTERDHPLFARVTVNRFWEALFGTGLVKTTEDFGTQAEPPSHPALLDWLALRFMQSAWNVKDLFRLMVTSVTYRQSGAFRSDLAARDPDNRWLGRGPRRRLPATSIRDQALAASGLLVPKIGGRPVRPYQPPGLWREVSGDLADFPVKTHTYERDRGAPLYRRSVYVFWKRASPPPMLAIFDAQGRDVCSVRQSSTNTPLQALNLLNDVAFVETARLLAARMLIEGGPSFATRLEYGFELLLARPPAPLETQLLQDSFAEHLRDYQSNPEAAHAFVSHGDSPNPPSIDTAEHAAMTQMALLLLNLDETVTKP